MDAACFCRMEKRRAKNNRTLTVEPDEVERLRQLITPAGQVTAGFDFDNPSPKAGYDPAVKLRKLSWARRIIDSLDGRIQLVRLSE